MNRKDLLSEARDLIYQYYGQVVAERGADKPNKKMLNELKTFAQEENLAYWQGRIIDTEFRGGNYFLGEIVARTNMTPSDSDKEFGVVISRAESEGFEGIKTFGEYTSRRVRTIMGDKDRVIVLGNSIERLKDPEVSVKVRHYLDSQGNRR
tara:strand:- start:268 stop:720 length:453 start_codon:yes stop_codon:yes gene_type:complete